MSKQVRIFKVDKLIRDKLPQYMTNTWQAKLFERIMSEKEHIERLQNKLFEEAQELIVADSPKNLIEEFCDVYEVLDTLREKLGVTAESISAAQIAKKERLGGFALGLYSPRVEVPSDSKMVEYYSKRPQDYPELDGPECE